MRLDTSIQAVGSSFPGTVIRTHTLPVRGIFLHVVMFLFLLHPLTAGDPPEGVQYSVPMQFTVNAGQWREDILFGILNGKETLSLRPDGLYVEAPMQDESVEGEMHSIEYGWVSVDRSSSLSFIDGNPQSVLGVDSLRAVSNFYLGSHSDSWYEAVVNHGRVVYRDVWPHIDVEYEAKGSRLLQRIRYRPGADPKDARFLVRGAHMRMALETAIIRGGMGEEAQMSNAQFVWSGDTVGYRLERGMVYNGYCLETEFTTFLSGLEKVASQITDDSGELTLVARSDDGLPLNNAWPVNWGVRSRVCIVRFSCYGRELVFSTYASLRMINNNSMYERRCRLVSETDSTFYFTANWMPPNDDHTYQYGGNLPVTNKPLQEYDSVWTSYLGRFSRTGRVIYGSTFGHRWEKGKSMIFLTDVERADDGSVYVLGAAKDEDFPYVSQAALFPPIDEWGSFILHLGAACDTVLAGSFFVPGDYTCFATDFSIDTDGSILLAGQLDYGELPVTANAFQSIRPIPEPYPSGLLHYERWDNFVARLSSDLDEIEYCSYLGGSRAEDIPYSTGGSDSLDFHFSSVSHASSKFLYPKILPDGKGGYVVAGVTRSANFSTRFPAQSEVRIDPLARDINGFYTWDGTLYLSNFDYAGALLFSTYHGGAGSEFLQNMQVLDCGRIFLGGLTYSKDYTLKNSAASRDSLLPGAGLIPSAKFVSVYNTDGSLYTSTLWGDSRTGISSIDNQTPRYEFGGYIYLVDNLINIGYPNFFFNACNSFWFELDSLANAHVSPISRYYFPLCDEDFLGCDLRAPGRVVIDTVRRSIVPARFPLRLTTFNPHESYIATGTELRLLLPEGMRLDSADQGAVRYLPSAMGLGDSITTVWNVVVDTGQGLPDLSRIEVEQWYRIAGLSVNCLRSYSACALDIQFERGSMSMPELRCYVETPDTVSNEESSLPLRLVLENLGQEHSGTLRATVRIAGEGVAVNPIGDTTRTFTVDAGNRHEEYWLLRADRRAWPRDVRIRVDIEDAYGRLPLDCSAEVYIEAAPGLSCALEGLDRIAADSTDGSPLPRDFTLTGILTNITDAEVTALEAHPAWSSAPWLRIAPGKPSMQTMSRLEADSTWTTTWRLEATGMPADTAVVDIRLAYRHASDTTWNSCMHQVTAYPRRTDLSCALAGTDSIRFTGNLPEPSELLLSCNLQNDGSIARTLTVVELHVPDGAGVKLLDPARQAGATLAPGDDMLRQWRLHPRALRPNRFPVFEVRAYAAGTQGGADTLVSACTHDVFIEGVDGLLCTATATDTVRFQRNPARYEPDTVHLDVELRNILDTAETQIEAVIDLTQAPRLKLVPGEVGVKSLAMVDSHSTSTISWLLTPLPGSTDAEQLIGIRYRSAQETAWKFCEAAVVIEEWPEETGLTCSNGGHDSLYSDRHYERFIPYPLHVSYTVTNTGTVTLTGCEATIIPPPAFALAGSDSTQLFTSPAYGNEPGGPVSEGTLLPGRSCTRWWKLSPTQALNSIDPRQIRWVWASNEQGSAQGCEHTIAIIPDNPSGIELTPLYLRFEAERGGALPADKQVQLWTGGGLAMPWTAQSTAWWLDTQPAVGSQSTQISVRPSSTQLAEGMHETELVFSSTPPARSVEVHYIITKSTSAGDPPTAQQLALEAWPQPATAGGMLQVRITDTGSRALRLTLYDPLGRERRSVYAESGSVIQLSLSGLAPGLYWLRARGKTGMVTRAVVVR